MYFQLIYRFEVDMLNKLAMSLPPEQSRPKEISAGRDDFEWGSCWKKPPRPPNRAVMNALIEKDIKVVLPLPCLSLSISISFANTPLFSRCMGYGSTDLRICREK